MMLLCRAGFMSKELIAGHLTILVLCLGARRLTDSGNLVMRFSCSFKYGTSCHFESSHKNKILCMYISYALLKSVFPKIRVRT